MHSFQRYGWLKNPGIWLGDSILAYNLYGRIFPGVCLYREMYFVLLPAKGNEEILRKLWKTQFWAFFDIFDK